MLPSRAQSDLAVLRLRAPGLCRPLRAGLRSRPADGAHVQSERRVGSARLLLACNCFSVLDQDTKNELSSRSAEGRRCRLARRGQYARNMCQRAQRPTRDRRRTARRSQSCRGRTTDVARWPGSPARAMPTAEDASPGPPGRLVVRACFVCRLRTIVKQYSESAYQICTSLLTASRASR
jgi:hypothetical protein